MEKQHQWNIWYFVLSFVLLVVVQSWWAQQNAVQTLPYSEFLRLLEEDKLLELKVEQQRISGKLKEPINGRSHFTTNRVDPALAGELAQSQVTFTGVRGREPLHVVVSILFRTFIPSTILPNTGCFD